MFGVGITKKSKEELPLPPSTQEILEDLQKAGPDDVVFTTNIGDLSANLDQASRHFQLQKRFQVIFLMCLSVRNVQLERLGLLTFDLCEKKC